MSTKSIPEPQMRNRRVSALSREQLERKRAHDRICQRNIRQRTKEYISQLEDRVAELEIKRERLHEVLQRNSRLEDEIRTIRHQLLLVHGGVTGQFSDQSFSWQSRNTPKNNTSPTFGPHVPSPSDNPLRVDLNCPLGYRVLNDISKMDPGTQESHLFHPSSLHPPGSPNEFNQTMSEAGLDSKYYMNSDGSITAQDLRYAQMQMSCIPYQPLRPESIDYLCPMIFGHSDCMGTDSMAPPQDAWNV